MVLEKNITKKFALFFIKTTFLAFFALSCVTSKDSFKEIDYAVGQSSFTSAIDVIKKGQSRNRAIYNRKNAISLFIDKGLLEYYAGNYEASSIDLQTAEKLIEEAYTRSISESFLTYILNDNVKEYPGEDFEDIYINVFNALNYYNKGDIEGALVEIRKLSISNGKLDMLARKYEYTDPSTGRSLNDMVEKETGIKQLPVTRTVNFSNSALARFLSALFYQAIGNYDSARIEFDQVQRAFLTNRNVYKHPIPTAVQQARNVPAEKVRLNIISFTGLSPIKEETIILQHLPFHHPILQIATFRVPSLIKRPSQITKIEVIVNDEKINLELLEDMGSVIEETFLARYANILAKTYIRTIIKYAVADVASIVATGENNELSGALVALAARLGMDASEGADIRMSRYLPDRAYIGGINLDPGSYSVIINYYNGSSIIAIDNREVMVNSNSLNLLQTVNLK